MVASFQTTRWSLVVAAGGDNSSAARAALASLCELYWYPLYAYVRRHGYSPDDAADLTQAFFTSLLERRDFEMLGTLLKESHRSLRDDFEVSTPHVDALVERAWAAQGCYGARIMGAGFGGSILALIDRGSEGALEAAVERPIIVCSTADGAFAQKAA